MNKVAQLIKDFIWDVIRYYQHFSILLCINLFLTKPRIYKPSKFYQTQNKCVLFTHVAALTCMNAQDIVLNIRRICI